MAELLGATQVAVVLLLFGSRDRQQLQAGRCILGGTRVLIRAASAGCAAAAQGLKTNVIGVPKTIDGGLSWLGCWQWQPAQGYKQTLCCRCVWGCHRCLFAS